MKGLTKHTPRHLLTKHTISSVSLVDRVVFQAPEERNYHIFYQLCASREEEEYAHLHLDEPEEFIYLNHGECTEIDDVDDAKELESTKQALNTLGMCDLHSKMSTSNVH